MLKQINSMMRRHLDRGGHQRQLREHAWAVDFKGALIHTLFRSRGFATRRFSHILSDAFETTALFYVADPQLIQSGYKLSLAFLLSILSTSSIDQFYRRLVVRNQEPSLLWLHIISQLVTICVFVLAAKSLQIDAVTVPLIVLFGSKLLCASVIAATNIVTLPISTVQRIYFPPWINVSAVLTCLSIHVATRYLSNLSGFYVLVVATFSVKLFVALYPLRYAFSAARLRQLEARRTDVKPDKVTFPNATWINLLLLFLLQVSALATPMLMSRSFYRSLPVSLGLVASAYMIVATSLLARPFKTIYIESLRALRREQWAFLAIKVRMASGISRAGYLLFVGMNIGILSLAPNVGVLLATFWASIFTFNTLFIHRAAVLTMERDLILPALTLRLAVLPLMSFLTQPTAGMSLVLVVCVELVLALDFLRRHWYWDLVGYTQSTFYKSNLQLESHSATPGAFLLKHSYFDPQLRSLGISTKLYRVNFTRKHSQVELISLSRSLCSELGPRRPFMFMSGSELLVWCTQGTDQQALSKKLLLKFPLIVSKVSVSQDLVHEVYPRALLPASTSSVNSLSLTLSDFLTKRLSELSPNILFKWWVLNGGVWTSESGRPDSSTAGVLFRLVESADLAAVFKKTWSHTPDESDRRYIAFRPHAQVTAVLEVERSAHVDFALTQMAAEQFAVIHQVPSYDVSPKDWFTLKRFLMDITDLAVADLKHDASPVSGGSAQNIKIASTQLGPKRVELCLDPESLSLMPRSESQFKKAS